MSKRPLYVINGTVIKGKDLNATAKFFIHLEEKLLQGNINYTPGIIKHLFQIFNHIVSPCLLLLPFSPFCLSQSISFIVLLVPTLFYHSEMILLIN
jgi:hypothetical protein